MGTATRFWNWNADRYSRQTITDEESYRKKLEITGGYLKPEMSVLEFGCGTGTTAIVHAAKVKTYAGIDISERMVEIAREKAEAAGLGNLTFSVGTLEAAEVDDASYDAVLGLNILHLVPDLDGTIATVARLLEPGGFFFSSTICVSDLEGMLRLVGPVTRMIPLLPSVQSFGVAALEARFAAAGLAVIERSEQRPGVIFHVAAKA